jgi:hypothetical protein
MIEMRMADDALEQSHHRGIISGETIGVTQQILTELRSAVGKEKRLVGAVCTFGRPVVIR